MPTAKKRKPRVEGAAKPVTGEFGIIKALRDSFTWVGVDTENPDKAVKKFGLRYFEDEVEMKDAQYRNCVRIRKSGVLKRRREITPASDDPLDIEVAEFVKHEVQKIKGGFRQKAREMLDGLSKGYSLHELVYQDAPYDSGPYAGKWGLKALKHKPPEMFEFATDEYGNLKENGIRMRKPQSGFLTDLPTSKFVCFVADSKYENPYGRGLASTCVWYVWFKKNGAKFRVVFAEKWASPTPAVKVPAAATDLQLGHVQRILDMIQQSTGIWYPEGFDVKLLETLRSGADVYQSLADWCDEQIAKCVLGQPGTTESGSESSYASKRSDLTVQDEIIDEDAEALADVVNEQMIKRLVDYNYVVENYPTLNIVAPKRTANLDSETLKTLVGAGLPVGFDYCYDNWGIQKPKEGEQTLVIVPAAPAPATPFVHRFADMSRLSDFAAPEVETFTHQVTGELTSVVQASVAVANDTVCKDVEAWFAAVKSAKVFDTRDLTPVKDIALEFAGLADQIYGLLYFGALKGVTDGQRILVREGWRPRAKFSDRARVERFDALAYPREESAARPLPPVPPKPVEALAYFRQLQVVLKDVYEKKYLQGKATTVAWAESQGALKSAQNHLLEAMENGWTFEQFRDRLLADPKFTDAYFPPIGTNVNAHLETIFETNLNAAYNQGRIQMFEDPDLEGFVIAYAYNGIEDGRECEVCATMNGRVYPPSSPVWIEFLPPIHYRCRCYIEPVTATRPQRESPLPPRTVTIDGKEIAIQPGQGFGRVGEIET